MNLVIALLSTRTFITAERIRETVSGYADNASDEAFSRMFERDKNELRDLGIPLETGRVSQFDPTEGYRINREAYALPAVELTADEAAAVAVAVQLWQSPELITATQGALLKLRAAGTDIEAVDAAIAITSTAALPSMRGSEEVLGILLSAIDSGQAVQFNHRPTRSDPYTTRTVEPWGVVTDQGPLVSRGARPGPRRDPHLPAVPHRSRSDGDRSARCGEAARWDRSARDRRPRGGRVACQRCRRRCGSPTAEPPRCGAARPFVGPRTLGGRAGEEIQLEIGMIDRLCREIASYGARRRRAGTRGSPRRCDRPAACAGGTHRRGARMTAISTRLVRLLNMVPYFQANPKITYAEAASDLGVSVKQLRDDLNQLWMCGLPGYGPGDLIDFEFSGDTIEVTFSAGIDHPLRLTSPEATGVLVALRALADVPGMVDPEAARSAIAKIESAAGVVGHGDGTPAAAVEEPAPIESEAAAAVRAAARDGRALSIEYYSASHDMLSSRVVDPIRVVLVADHSYLEAWCRSAEGVRLFRFDRIVDAHVLDEPSAPPPPAVQAGPDTSLFDADPSLPSATLLIERSASWMFDYYPLRELRELPDGACEAAMTYASEDWMTRFVLGFGSAVRVLTPESLAERVRESAAAALNAYGVAG